MLNKIIQLCRNRIMMGFIQFILCASLIWFAPAIVQALQTGVIIQHNGVNLGRVSEGPNIVHTFELWNISFHDIQIRQISPGCSCSVIKSTKHIISPLQHSSITMAINTTGIGDGEMVKTVGISLGDKRELIAYVRFYVPSTVGND